MVLLSSEFYVCWKSTVSLTVASFNLNVIFLFLAVLWWYTWMWLPLHVCWGMSQHFLNLYLRLHVFHQSYKIPSLFLSLWLSLSPLFALHNIFYWPIFQFTSPNLLLNQFTIFLTSVTLLFGPWTFTQLFCIHFNSLLNLSIQHDIYFLA